MGLRVGGAGHPFVGDWGTKGLYAYRSGQYNGIAYFGAGGDERNRLEMPHESEKYRPWNRYDPDIPDHIRKKLIELEDDDSTSVVQPHHARRGNSEIRDEEGIRLFKKTLDDHGVPSDFLARTQTSRSQPARTPDWWRTYQDSLSKLKRLNSKRPFDLLTPCSKQDSSVKEQASLRPFRPEMTYAD